MNFLKGYRYFLLIQAPARMILDLRGFYKQPTGIKWTEIIVPLPMIDN